MADTPFRTRDPITDDDALPVLIEGTIDVLGRMPWSSNATFLVDICRRGTLLQGIYKPERGERPLWDFPTGIYTREIACYELSRALSWDLVPPTVERDGPLGIGSLQLFVPCDYEQHYFTLLEEERHHRALQALCLFDVVANSTDRKGGHMLLGDDDRIYAIDNGLSFHTEFKLRTVIWDWQGELIPAPLLDGLLELVEQPVPGALAELLTTEEREAMLARTHSLVQAGRFPVDPTGRRYPWPLV